MRLELTDIYAYYGQSHILQGVSRRVAEGDVVAPLGRNDACKTTTMRSITGLTVHQNLELARRDAKVVRPIWTVERSHTRRCGSSMSRPKACIRRDASAAELSEGAEIRRYLDVQERGAARRRRPRQAGDVVTAVPRP